MTAVDSAGRAATTQILTIIFMSLRSSHVGTLPVFGFIGTRYWF